MSFSVTVNNDWNTAKVVLAISGIQVDRNQHIADLDPRQARRIAQQLLKAADDAEDQAVQLNKKGAQK
jgi:hypothetical protein